uniref:NTR domain-containing protein n=1 Tax=Parascaris univalens TaxID=6257 RepID=A0A915CCL7_PARUN
MKHCVTLFLLFSLLIVALKACKCGSLSPKESYSNAQWVTRAKILRRQSKKIDGMGYIEYKVNHIDVFKNKRKPRKLPDEITTLASSAACGFPSLGIGKEYLLSGRFVEGDVLRMYACEQIIVKIKDGKPLDVVLEWNEVPNDLRKKLNSGNV